MHKCLAWLKNKASEANLADWLVAFFTLIIAAATIVYTIYARRQWQAMIGQLSTAQQQLTEMSKQYPELKQSAEAANTAASVARATFIQEYGEANVFPNSISIVGFGVGTQTVVKIYFENQGKPPADSLAVAVQVGFRSQPPSKYPIDLEVAPGPALHTYRNWKDLLPVPYRMQTPISKEDYAAYNFKSEKFYVWGVFQYRDPLGMHTPKRFCKYITAADVTYVGRQPTEEWGDPSKGQNFHECPTQ